MQTHELRIRENAAGLDIPLHVQTRSRRTEIAGYFNGALKLKVQAPPVDDAANDAIVRFFSDLLAVPKSRISIAAGPKSRDKILRIEGVSLSSLEPHLP